MKNSRIFCWILLAALWCPGLLTFGQAIAQESERMDTSNFESPRRPGAVFSHDDHNAAADLEDNCAVCHHVYEDGKRVADESSEDASCSDCHSLSPTVENGISLELAYHKRCRDCHFDTGKGPVLCGECHVKHRGERK